MKRIILASGSSRRNELLRNIGLDFEVMPSGYVEDNEVSTSPAELVELLSRGKARWVAGRERDSLIIAADTVMALEGSILGKPKDSQELKAMISKLSGRSHVAYTGFTVMEGARIKTESVATKVFFRDLSEEEIERYAQTGDGLDKAGGYGIQSRGALFVEKIEGDYFNVVGLPLSRLATVLNEFGVTLI